MSHTPPRGPHFKQRSAWMHSIRPASNKGKKYRQHKERGPIITLGRFLKAIRGSLGVIRRVARRLEVTPQAIMKALAKPRFASALVALHAETVGLTVAAVSTVSEMVTQRDEYKTALAAAKFILDRKGGWRQTIAVEGGATPLRVETTQQVSLDDLDLPLDVQRQVLERLEAEERERASSAPRPILRVRRVV